MKWLGLDANYTCLSRKIYWKLFQEASPLQNLVLTLKWMISKPVTLVLVGLVGEEVNAFLSENGL